jgi:hypothetical protein
MVTAFKQEEDEPLVKAWERFRGIAFGMEHGLRDWMLVHVFIKGCLTLLGPFWIMNVSVLS